MDWLNRFDLESFRAIHVGFHRPWLDPVFTAITYTGLGVSCVIGPLLLILWRSTRAYVVPILLALLIGGFIEADGIKELITRDRPSNLVFAHPQEQIYQSSFPSGHTADAFSLAFTLLLLTRGTPRAKWGWLALGWAALVGFSRIYRGVHWPTDVIGGMFCGLVAACIVTLIQGSRVQPKAGYHPSRPRGMS